ncbi:hypothetical protein DFH06DRAFT_734030 [Mycena polygramma]|nr:hypothetical protein DFH06DRAFT_734030 [Mycena polygramma]
MTRFRPQKIRANDLDSPAAPQKIIPVRHLRYALSDIPHHVPRFSDTTPLLAPCHSTAQVLRPIISRLRLARSPQPSTLLLYIYCALALEAHFLSWRSAIICTDAFALNSCAIHPVANGCCGVPHCVCTDTRNLGTTRMRVRSVWKLRTGSCCCLRLLGRPVFRASRIPGVGLMPEPPPRRSSWPRRARVLLNR